MNKYFETDPWKVIQEGFSNETNEVAESVMSLANGHMGFRGNFEEDFSGKSLKGTYIAGVYYPDKTKVGWWKNGYPEYFAKVLNACDFLMVHLKIDDYLIDVNTQKTENFSRVLDMKHGDLTRMFDVILPNQKKVRIQSKRFVSMAESEIGAIKYSIQALDEPFDVLLDSCIQGDVRNSDTNYDEAFWDIKNIVINDACACVSMVTKKTHFHVSTAVQSFAEIDGVPISFEADKTETGALCRFKATLKKGQRLTLYKYFSVTTNRDYENEQVEEEAKTKLNGASKKGFDRLYQAHTKVWEAIWMHSDIAIKGDDSAQQGIRFNIFQLNQTYTGKDSRLNIGPKGFTGEKYGGTTYWDTEAYCLPFFLSTAKEAVSKNLLIYRYNHLEKAKENAAKLGLKGALYPMVTMNGEECHNEWEITFEEIHRNAAITYAIYNYVNYTGDMDYVFEYGIDVLYETSRFWASRVNYSVRKKKYMILGVTGPNEYENNVNNNYYTNRMCVFSLAYTLDMVNKMQAEHQKQYQKAVKRLDIVDDELDIFRDIANNMYYAFDDEYQLFLQQDGFMDKDIQPVEMIIKEERPINQHWSWDRILRSCYIKQADVLQAIYHFSDDYTCEDKKRHFDFYEPMTVHESSLSPCIYSIIASDIGYEQKAYDLYLRASRLDLDNYNHDTEDGLHITSMAGTWLAIVHGFGGLKVRDNMVHISPTIPECWDEYAFKIYFRGTIVNVLVTKHVVMVDVLSGASIQISIFGAFYHLKTSIEVKRIKKQSECT